MGGSGRVVHQERFVGRHRLLELHPVDRLVGHVGGEVVTRGVRSVDLDDSVVDQRLPLVGFPADEAIELLEALMRRPAIVGAGHGDLPRGRLVPLAERSRVVSVLTKNLSQWHDARRNLTLVAREAGRDLHHGPHVGRVMVPARLQRSARRRAQRRGVELVEANALIRESLEGRRLDGTAERCSRAEADVVDQHDHDVGCALWSGDLEARGSLRLSRVELGDRRVLRRDDRQDRAVDVSVGDRCVGHRRRFGLGLGLRRSRLLATHDEHGAKCGHDPRTLALPHSSNPLRRNNSRSGAYHDGS